MVAIDKRAGGEIKQYSYIPHEETKGVFFFWQEGGPGARGIIGSFTPGKDGTNAHVIRGFGIDSEGCGFVRGSADDIPRLAYERLVDHVVID